MTVKVLGQVDPTVNTDTALYTVAAGKSAVCSTLVLCNRGAAPATVRVSVSVNGASITNKDYILYGISVPAVSSDFITIGLTLGPLDVVNVRTDTATVSFSLFGDES